VTDSTISAAGKPGVRLGTNSATNTPTNTTSLHLDNFRVVPNTGTTLTDSHGSNNGTLSNSPLLGEPGALAGSFNGSTQFDGTDDYGSIPDAASLDLGDGPFTLEAWVKRNDTPAGWHDIFDKGTGAYQVGFFGTEFDLAKDGTGVVSGATGAAGDTSAFHHWVVTKNGTSTKLYRDGVDVTGTITDYTMTNTATALYIASKNGSSEFLNARLDELAVYNQVLSAATVLDHYKAGAGTG
jgi:Concanavalin A-like lectin/glucanases superfamily